MLSSAAILVATAVASWVSVCDAIAVFPESVAEVGILPFPLYFGGLPIHVVALFIAFYLSMIIGSWAGKGRLDKELYNDYLEEYFEEHEVDFPDLSYTRRGRALGSETTMRQAMRKTLRQVDVDRCLQKLVCHLESQDDRTLEEDLLLRLFPTEDCEKNLFSKCAGKAEQLREVLRYYQRMAGLLISANEAGPL